MKLFKWVFGFLIECGSGRPHFVSSTNFITDGMLARVATLKRIREEEKQDIKA